MSKRIGILTGGGDCPGLNAVIRAVTLHARHTYGWEIVGIRNGFEGLYEEDYVDLDPCAGRSTLLARGGTMLGSSNRANPFAYPSSCPTAASRSTTSARAAWPTWPSSSWAA
jgi:6-phosphofructokinase